MLIGAVFASLALGVLVGYGLCQTMFRIFRLQVASSTKHQQVVAQTVHAGSH
jgi:hypothetical protein